MFILIHHLLYGEMLSNPFPACFEFLLQIDGRLWVVRACDRQNRVQRAIDFGISRSKQPYFMTAPFEVLADLKNDPLGSTVGFLPESKDKCWRSARSS
jgi:hypothetical protein